MRVSVEDGGRRLDWTPRVRIGGDVWDLEPAEIDPRRFRLRLLDGEAERGVVEVETTSHVFEVEALEAAFLGGIGAGAAVAVAQYGPGFGWGVDARASLFV